MKLPNTAYINRNALFIVLEGIAAAMVLNLYNPFTQIFAKRMGAGDFQVALINSLPQLVSILILIPCSILIERVKNKKLAACLIILVNSIFYAVIAFVPFLPNAVRLGAYILLIGLMNWPGSLYTTTWQSFFSGSFKGGEAGRLYSLRSMYGALFGFLTVFFTGLILTSASDSHRIFIYQVFYAICFLISVTQAIALWNVRQEPDTGSSGTEKIPAFILKDLSVMLKNKTFMIYSACVFVFHVSWQMGWPLFFIYNVDNVRMDEIHLALINVASGLTSFLTYPLWQRLSEKKGYGFVIILGALGLALNPFMYVVTTNFWLIVAVNAVVGIAVSGFTLSLFGNLLDILPEEKRTIYISLFNTFINVSGFISPLTGVWIKGYTGLIYALIIVGAFRFIAVLLFILRWTSMGRSKRVNLEKGATING